MTAETLACHRTLAGPHGAQEVAMYSNATDPRYPRHPGEVTDMAGYRNFIDGYDCGIRYMDDHIGVLLNALERQGVLDDLAIIVTADHGENMGELGIYAEHATADHATCRIPMIIRWPGCNAGHADTGLHYNLDLLPTLAALLGQSPSSNWDGASYHPALLQGEDCGRDYLVLSQCAHVCQRSVRVDDRLYMRTYHDGYHLFPDEMLFNLADDPHEEHNLASPQTCREPAALLDQWHEEMMATMLDGYDTDPLQTVLAEGGPFHANGQLPAYCERLRQTGRGHHVPELMRRHPGEFGRSAGIPAGKSE
ncbi:MAG: sulfatase family protein [Armatimonadota bacterium]